MNSSDAGGANRGTHPRDARVADPFEALVFGTTLSLASSPSLFSPRHFDRGTQAMLSCVTIVPDDRVLDLGCGCGVVGIGAAQIAGQDNVFLVDNDPVAVRCAQQNAAANGVPELSVTLSDGFRDFRETDFTKILCNPPYHTDFSVARHFILKGFNRLRIGGGMWFVTKRDTWYRKRFAAVFGGVQVQEVDSYFVIYGEKRRSTYARRI